jgi:hypothetical protein
MNDEDLQRWTAAVLSSYIHFYVFERMKGRVADVAVLARLAA